MARKKSELMSPGKNVRILTIVLFDLKQESHEAEQKVIETGNRRAPKDDV